MSKQNFRKALVQFVVALFCLLPTVSLADIARLRATFRDDPATTIVIAWDQVSGGRPVLYYDTRDHGQDFAQYPQQQGPTWANTDKGMNNVFVRLTGLQPNTVYYFVVQDTKSVSRRFTFRTLPDNPNEPLSIIAGSDSRNNREVRKGANRLVSKIRPQAILFGGDMTDDDSDLEWREWMDDWQLTHGSDGRVFPLIVARGNHEQANTVMVNLFDVPSSNVYYALTLGGSLLRVYTLNTQTEGGGEQRDWLGRDLQAHFVKTRWRIAQYHESMRPHTSKKKERPELISQWATLFHRYGVCLAIESDAHVVKHTWPIKPSEEAGNQEGFVRDDVGGTIYIGEGGWGAPLRSADDAKPWTRDIGSFNQFNWIIVSQDMMEVRTIKVDGSDNAAEVDAANPFKIPNGLVTWITPNGESIRIRHPQAAPPVATTPNAPRPSGTTDTHVPVRRDANGKVQVQYVVAQTADVDILLFDAKLQQLAKLNYPGQPAGSFEKELDLSRAPKGVYELIIKTNGQVVKKYWLTID